MYVLDGNGVKCECVITDEGNNILEIKNTEVSENAVVAGETAGFEKRGGFQNRHVFRSHFGGGGYGQGFGDFWQQAGWQQQTSGYEEEPRLRAAGNYLRNGYYREARNTLDGMGEHEKTARWYYYSAMAHMGLGNNVAALEHANKAVALDPQNMEYQMLLQRLQSGGQWYESRQAAYGYPHVGGNDLCLKICLANLFCNLCCGGGGLCFGGYGGRGMF